MTLKGNNYKKNIFRMFVLSKKEIKNSIKSSYPKLKILWTKVVNVKSVVFLRVRFVPE